MKRFVSFSLTVLTALNLNAQTPKYLDNNAPMEERMQAVEKILDLPDTVRAFAQFPFGYPAEERKQQDRFDAKRIHYVE